MLTLAWAHCNPWKNVRTFRNCQPHLFSIIPISYPPGTRNHSLLLAYPWSFVNSTDTYCCPYLCHILLSVQTMYYSVFNNSLNGVYVPCYCQIHCMHIFSRLYCLPERLSNLVITVMKVRCLQRMRGWFWLCPIVLINHQTKWEELWILWRKQCQD